MLFMKGLYVTEYITQIYFRTGLAKTVIKIIIANELLSINMEMETLLYEARGKHEEHDKNISNAFP